MSQFLTLQLIFLLLFTSSSMGQSSHVLPLIEVIDSTSSLFDIIPEQPFQNTHPISSIQSIHSTLTEQTNTHVRSYGPGRLATISRKGASPQQTAILYHGFNMQNPTLGLTDVSLFSGFLFEQVIESKTPGTLSGSGIFNNAIQIAAGLDLVDNVSYKFQFGGNNHWFHGIGVNVSGLRSNTLVKGYIDTGENNFQYRAIGGSELRLRNAKHDQVGFLVEHSQAIKDHSHFKAFMIRTSANRLIPPTRLQMVSDASQKDLLSRIGMIFTNHKQNRSISLRIALMDDQVDYLDPMRNIDSKNKGQSIQSIGSFSRKVGGKSEGMLQLEWIQQTGKSSNHSANSGRNQISFMGAYKHKFIQDKASFLFSGRFQWDEPSGLELLPYLNLQYKAAKSTLIYLDLQRTFRLPSLDDLFWTPGGNPELRPESGWHKEVGVKYDLNRNRLTHRMKILAYHRIIQDWILWVPGSSQIWSPENVSRVISRGLETDYHLIYRHANYQVKSQLIYTLQNVEEKYNDPLFKERDGNQLIYMPRHQLKINLAFIKDGWEFGMHQRIISSSFADHLNTSTVPGYLFSTIAIHKDWQFQKLSIRSSLKLVNVFNEDYEVIQHYPMHGRLFYFSLIANFKP